MEIEDKQRCITNFTIIADSIPVENYITIMTHDLGYKPLKYTCGIHREASRVHTHLMVIWDTSGCYKFKALNKKIQGIFKLCPKVIKPDRITYSYHTRISGIEKQYNESCLMYPFKEYENFDYIDLDHQYGYTEEELEDMRKTAHELWIKSQKMNEYEKTRAEKEKLKYEQLKLHLDKVTIHEYDRLEDKIADIAEAILDHKFKTQDKFRINDLKNQAVNYLYLGKKITNHDVLNICSIYR